MTTELRKLTPSNVKHVHSRTKMFTYETKDTSYLYSVKQTLNNLLDAFEFAEFEIKYSKDKDADTEYLILNGKGRNDTSVDIHIFSCYCDGSHPAGEPPF